MSKDTKNNDIEAKPGRLPSPRREGNSVVRSLLGSRLDELTVNKNQEALILPLEKLKPNPNQPRQQFDETQDQELAESVRQYGVLEPILVRKLEGDVYQIIAGERRYRAAHAAGLSEVPVLVKNFDDKDAKLVAVIENLQRADLNEMDEANYFQFLMDQFNLTEQEIADFIHRSRSYVNKRLQHRKRQRQTDVLRETALEGTEEADSEISNKMPQNTSKLNISQSAPKIAALTRPVLKFRTFLDKTREQLPDIQQEERASLNEELRQLRAQLEELERLLNG